MYGSFYWNGLDGFSWGLFKIVIMMSIVNDPKEQILPNPWPRVINQAAVISSVDL